MLLSPMKLYYCSYSNFHVDPNPVAFILSSDSQKTHSLNIRYLSISRRAAFFAMIRKLANVGHDVIGVDGTRQRAKFHYDGKMMYAILKKYYPDFVKMAYRTYFSQYLMGVLVNDCLSAGSPLMELYIKTQQMVNRGTSNFMENKAKNDVAVREVNIGLAKTRIAEMKQYEGLNLTLQKTPGPSAAPLPNQPSPDNQDPSNEPEGPLGPL